MTISWDLSELDNLAADLATAPVRVTAEARSATVKSLRDIETTGRALSPVLTGELRDSWSTDVDADGLGGEVGPSARHAPFVEYGTSVMGPQPSLNPAVDRAEPGWLQGLEQSMDRIL